MADLLQVSAALLLLGSEAPNLTVHALAGSGREKVSNSATAAELPALSAGSFALGAHERG
ncbi:hypothetical protein [Streptomyces violaceusniger]|uniref:hypothetical protein n=1 Tax=Streptomyces violaceusniger TaxID=68280 RepID=UPI0005B94687|nr:hypothetical protein [Streptomyces violaceusniger]